MRKDTLLHRLKDLKKQATEEHSHYYTSNLLQETIDRMEHAQDILGYLLEKISENENLGVHTREEWIVEQARCAKNLLES